MKLALSIEEACNSTGICKSSLYEAIKSGSLPAKKFGKRTIVLQVDLQAFLDGMKPFGVDAQ